MKVEQLAAAVISGHVVDDETSRWVAKIDELMIGKLAAVGLIPRRESATLQEFIDGLYEAFGSSPSQGGLDRIGLAPNATKVEHASVLAWSDEVGAAAQRVGIVNE